MLLFIIVLPVFPLGIGMPSLDISLSRTIEEPAGWQKPENLTIVALVFYGRRANVQLLERYLRVLSLIAFASSPQSGGLVSGVAMWL
jgi:hypothetical protein